MMQYIPNLITVVRFILVIPTVMFLLEQRYGYALIVFLVASISDALDGMLARYYQASTRFGSIMDPLADKLLLVSTFIALTYMGVLPFWLMVLIIIRDLIIISGAILYQVLYGSYELEPTRLSKVNTLFQISLVVITLTHQAAILILPAFISTMMFIIVAILAVMTCVQYFWLTLDRGWSPLEDESRKSKK